MRHPPQIIKDYDPPPGVSISTLEHEYKAGFEVPRHAHGSDQLIYAISGVMEVSSENSMWIIPPQFGVWIPATVPHSIHMPRAVSMRTLYIRKGQVALSRLCSVLFVTPLLRELIVKTVRIGRLRGRNRHESALRELIVDELQDANRLATFITLPREKRARTLARSVIDDPARPVNFSVLCAQNGVGIRTMQRVFQRELGSDFNGWRRQVRITKAVELLASGESVKEAAHQVGYSQPSSFIGAFRSTMGFTPKAWIKSLERR